MTVSYFEWVQDRQGFFWNEELVNDRLEEIMVEQLQRRGGVCGKARGGQPHGRLYAGAGSGGVRDQAARHLRVSAEMA